MKKNISILSVLFFGSSFLFAQETASTETKPANKPVKHTFENQLLINNQTVENPPHKTLDFVIEHRFGIIKDENDMYGLFAPSNIRMGLTYGITERLAAGVGATKANHLYDLQWKYILLRQTKTKGVPVTVSYFGDVAREAGAHTNFINQDGEYKQTDRLSFFHELMVARKITTKISAQAAFTYSYFNIVDTTSQPVEHGSYGASFAGRYQFSPQSSVLIEFDFPITTRSVTSITSSSSNSETSETKYYPKPNFGIGYEVATSGHQFQIFVCSADAIINQVNRVYNQNDFFDKGLLLGFNITRQWGF